MPLTPGESSLAPWRFDPYACQDELAAFERLLAGHEALGEREDILPFFRSHLHLAAFLSSYHPNLITSNRLGLEVPLFGQFQADAIVGDRTRHAFCLVEFEDGRANSVFVRRGRQTSDWASRLEHGFSQIVDWLWLLDDQRQTDTFEGHFGARQIDVFTLLVVGRDQSLSEAERRRLAWRARRVVVDSRHVHCCTYDMLAVDLRERLDALFRQAGLGYP